MKDFEQIVIYLGLWCGVLVSTLSARKNQLEGAPWTAVLDCHLCATFLAELILQFLKL